MKRVKDSRVIYDKYITMDNLYRMWDIVKRTCKNKREIYYFSLNLNSNLYDIWVSLKNRSYRPSKYKTFMIFEPKPRLVMSQTVKDKIVNHFITNYYLIPYIESSLIDSNVATRKDKGSSYAMKLLKKYFNRIIINNPKEEIYCLKIDVSKYFYSINHKKLTNMLKKDILDTNVINLIDIIIRETNLDYINRSIERFNSFYNVDIPFYKNGVGLSIGAMSSQFLAIYYLNDIDHYIKEVLKCKYYIRYMDDFLILDTNKNRLLNIYKIITFKLNELSLNVNKKSNIYRCSKGFSFLGYVYKVINDKLYISCKKENCNRIRKKLLFLKKNDSLRYILVLGSYNGYFKPVYNIGRSSFKVVSNSRKLYDYYKGKYNNMIVIVKEGIFYKSYVDDAKIIWYLFSYKYNNDCVSFGNNSYDKVILKLKKSNISFIVVDKEKELLLYSSDDIFYNSYCSLASKSYEKYELESKIVDEVRSIIENCPDKCEVIWNFLCEIK